MGLDSMQAITTLAAMAALGEAGTAKLCAYAGEHPGVVVSILRLAPDVIAEGQTGWRVRDLGRLRALVANGSGSVVTGAPDGPAAVIPSDVAVAERLCIAARAATTDVTREVLARTALHLVGKLHPQAHARHGSARPAVLATPTGTLPTPSLGPPAVAPKLPGGLTAGVAAALGRRAYLVVLSAALLRGWTTLSGTGAAGLDAVLEALSADGELRHLPLYRLLLDLLRLDVLRANGDTAARSAMMDKVRRLSDRMDEAAADPALPVPLRREQASLLADYLTAPTRLQSRRVVERHPWLLGDEAGEVIQHTLRTLREQDELAIAGEVERRVEPLRRARAIGVAAAFAGQERGDGLGSLVMAFIDAPTWAESREMLRERPELLDDLVLAGIAHLMDRAGETADLAAVESFAAHLALVRRCRADGLDAAFAERSERDLNRAKPRSTASSPLAQMIFARLVQSISSIRVHEPAAPIPTDSTDPDYPRLAAVARSVESFIEAQPGEEHTRRLLADVWVALHVLNRARGARG